MVIFLLFQIPLQLESTGGTSIATAQEIGTGSYGGSISSSSEIHYYNFTAHPLRTYRFTLDVPNNDYINLAIYTNLNVLIQANTTSALSKFLIKTGYDKYIIRVVGSEFIVPPAPYTLTVSEEILGPKEGIATAENIVINTDYTESFTSISQSHTYNFSGHRIRKYNLTLDVPGGDYLYFHVYNPDGRLLWQKTDFSTSKFLVLYGYRNYIVKVIATEFMVFPAEYTLRVTEIIGAPGEGIASATPLTIGNDHSHSFESIYQSYWYNFTGIQYRMYKVNLHIPNSDYLYLVSYSEDGTILTINSTFSTEKSVILKDQEKYVIGVFATEFVSLPAPYTISVEEFIGEKRLGIASAENINPGYYNGELDSSNNVNWFNLTTNENSVYNLSIYHTESHLDLQVFDSNLNLIDNIASTTDSNSLIITGHSKYIIRLVTSDSTAYPFVYILALQDITPITDNTTQYEQQPIPAEEDGFNLPVPFPYIFILQMFAVIILIRKIKITHK
ncbi:MAG: hypothetical protein OEZ01_18195 [Candidatus Heimdallarchaeota archaeon]|nr:hypothetical protein [Candidatus Heimdallarchaeota archaeon]MDH5647947.1 hypothetical protein [Candidatus Heimdallarchaeota archaeon]